MKTNLIAAIWLTALITLSLTGCAPKVKVHCDACGAEVVTTNTNVDESWDLYCSDCAEELGLNDLVTPN